MASFVSLSVNFSLQQVDFYGKVLVSGHFPLSVPVSSNPRVSYNVFHRKEIGI